MVKYNVIIIYYIRVFHKTDYAVRLPSHLNISSRPCKRGNISYINTQRRK